MKRGLFIGATTAALALPAVPALPAAEPRAYAMITAQVWGERFVWHIGGTKAEIAARFDALWNQLTAESDFAWIELKPSDDRPIRAGLLSP